MNFNRLFLWLVMLVIWGGNAQAATVSCGSILAKAKQLPKNGKGKAPCVMHTQIPGEYRGSFVTLYLCEEGRKKVKYRLTTFEDFTCEAKVVP